MDYKTADSLCILDLSLPFTEQELKSAFRKKAFKFHPDKTNGDTEEQMKKINRAYEILKNYTQPKTNIIAKRPKPEDGKFRLWEICSFCNGKGIKETPLFGGACPDCEDDSENPLSLWFMKYFFFIRSLGYHFNTCPSCKGIGFLNQKTCVRCNGTGRIKKVCQTCNGKGHVKGTVTISYCPHCGGIGEKEVVVFNPVIKMGCILK